MFTVQVNRDQSEASWLERRRETWTCSLAWAATTKRHTKLRPNSCLRNRRQRRSKDERAARKQNDHKVIYGSFQGRRDDDFHRATLSTPLRSCEIFCFFEVSKGNYLRTNNYCTSQFVPIVMFVCRVISV